MKGVASGLLLAFLATHLMTNGVNTSSTVLPSTAAVIVTTNTTVPGTGTTPGTSRNSTVAPSGVKGLAGSLFGVTAGCVLVYLGV